MSNDSKWSGVRLSGFAAASLWHRRLVRTHALGYVRVRPRLSAELVLHSILRDGGKTSNVPGRADDSRHAA